MKAALLIAGSGPLVILTSQDPLFTNPVVIKKLRKGIETLSPTKSPLSWCRRDMADISSMSCKICTKKF